MTKRERYALETSLWAVAWMILGFMESWWALLPAAMTMRYGWKWYCAPE